MPGFTASVDQRTRPAARNRLEMNGVFQQGLVDRVGDYRFIASLVAVILAEAIISAIREVPWNRRQYCLSQLPPCRSQTLARWLSY